MSNMENNNEENMNVDKDIKIITINRPNNLENINKNNINKNNINNINLNKNSNSNTNDSSNSEGISIDLFGNNTEELIINTEEAVSKEERVIRNDAILEKDLENSLIKSLPLYKQNDIFSQREASKRAGEIIKLKNIGVDEFEKGFNYYNVIDDYENSIYNTSWVIPIIADKQIKYGNELEQYKNKNKDTEYTKVTTNGGAIVYKDRNIEFSKLKEYKKQQFTTQLRLYNNEIEPYLPDNDQEKRLNTEEKNTSFYSTRVSKDNMENLSFLRLSNFNNILWSKRTVSMDSSFCDKTKIEIYGEGDGGDYGQQSERLGAEALGAPHDCITTENYKSRKITLLPSERLNVVGFYVAPMNETINDIKKIKKVGEITEIKNNILTIKDHGLNTKPYEAKQQPYKLSNETYIVIRNSDVKSVNGIYNDITIIDKDHIYINMKVGNIDFTKSEQKPILYGPRKLEYQFAHVNKDGKIEIIDKIENNSSKTKSKSKPLINKPTIYLFDKNIGKSKNKSIEENIYKKMVDAIIPSINDILKYLFEYTTISKSISVTEINKHLEKFKIEYSDLRLYQFDKIQKIIDENIESEFSNKSLPIKDQYIGLYKYIENRNANSSDTNNINNNNNNKYDDLHFINKTLLKSKKITDYYGDYEIDIKDDPNISSFIEWLMSKEDFGKLYINYLLLDHLTKNQNKKIKKSNDNNDSNEKDIASNDIKTVKRQIIRIKKEIQKLEKESGVHTFFKDDKECAKYSDSSGSDSNKKVTCDLDGLVIDEDTDISTLDFDDLKCMYDEKTDQCRSKKQYRVEQKIDEYKQKLEEYTELEKELETNKTLNQIEINIAKYIGLFKGLKQLEKNKEQELKNINRMGTEIYEEEKKKEEEIKETGAEDGVELIKTINIKTQNEEIEEDKEQKEALDQVVKNTVDEEYDTPSYKIYKLIQEIDDTFLKQQLLFELIKRDGILINNFYHSKKYGHPLFCGHWKYIYMIDSNNGNNGPIFNEMLGIYGDNGEADLANHSCKYCGARLTNMELSELEGFNEYGERTQSREIWYFADEGEKDDIYDCESKEYKDMLERNDITSLKDIELMNELCKIMGSVQRKIGVVMTIEDSEYILVQCKNFINNMRKKIPPYDVFKAQLIKKVGLAKVRKLLKRNSSYITDEYKKFKYTRIYPTVSALVLIKIQISCPRYQVSNRLTSCIFRSFDDELGAEYMLCVISELMRISQRKMELVKSFFEKAYNYFSNFYEIRESLTKCRIQKENKEKEMRNRQDKIRKATKSSITTREDDMKANTDIDNIGRIGVISVDDLKKKLSSKYISLDNINKKDIALPTEKAEEQQEQVAEKQRALIKILLNEFSTVVGEQQLDNPFDIVSSCCDTTLDKYYDDFFEFEKDKKNGENGIEYVKRELREIENINKKLIKAGSNSRLLINKPLPQTPNIPVSIITLMDFPGSENTIYISDLYTQMFLSFCHHGYTEGEYHDFFDVSGKTIKQDDKRCIKCGDIYEDLEKREYSKSEYEKLRNAITKKSTTFDIVDKLRKIREKIIKQNQEQIKKLIKEAKSNISIEKKTFVDRLANLMGESKNNVFKNKYANIVNDFGKVKYLEGDKNSNSNTNSNNNQLTRLDEQIANLKDYINEYLRQYISVIANTHDRNLNIKKIINTTTTEMERLTKKIIERNNLIDDFISPNNVDIFKNKTNFSFNYTIEQIDYIDSINDTEESKREIITLLLYLFLQQMNKMMMSNKKVVAEFIIKMIDIIEADSDFFNANLDEIDNEILYYKQQQAKQRELKYQELLLERKEERYREEEEIYDDDTLTEKETQEKRKALASLISPEYNEDGELVDDLLAEEEVNNNIMRDYVTEQEKIDNDDILDDVEDYGEIPEDEDYGDYEQP